MLSSEKAKLSDSERPNFQAEPYGFFLCCKTRQGMPSYVAETVISTRSFPATLEPQVQNSKSSP